MSPFADFVLILSIQTNKQKTFRGPLPFLSLWFLLPRMAGVITSTQSHRTVTRVTSVSSLPLLLLFLAISMAIAAAPIPFWETTIILGTGFFLTNPELVRCALITTMVSSAVFVYFDAIIDHPSCCCMVGGVHVYCKLPSQSRADSKPATDIDQLAAQTHLQS